MISRFFIDRPIFASVVSIVMTLIGAIALLYLPIAQYPRITPPGVSISISYPGANAKIVADTVAAPIEQQVNGVPGMLYMSSQMGNDGSYTLTVTFDIGVDLNTALVMVQNRVTLAMPQLPTQVQKQGITIRKKTPDILMIVNLFSPDQRYNDIYLSNYATINLRDELLRVQGVSDVTYQGQRDYSIRIWLDPQKLAAREMTALDVADAIRSQNLDAPAGQLGQQPAPNGQTFQLPIDVLGRLTEPEDFADIIVKVNQATPPATATGSPRSVLGNLGVPSAASSGGAGASRSSTGTTGTAGGGAAAPNSVTRGGGASSTATVGGTSSSSSRGSSALSTSSSATLGVSTAGGGSASGGGNTSGGGAALGGGSTGGSASGAPSSMPQPSAMPDAGAIEGISINSAGGGGSSADGSALSAGQPSTAIVRVRDIGTVELGAQNYNQGCLLDGQPSVGLAVYQLPGTNALDVADRVKAKMEELKSRFPEGVDYLIAYDTTPFIRESVSDVEWTLLLAVLLVAGVVLLFLQNWRSVIIPLIAVPVAIVSTFAVMAALNFSLNNISLFGLVLAIGIVVDDAIVVVENVERWMEHGLEPREATRRAMEEVTGPIIAVALVLSAVFVPCAFVGGITGQFFRQFAVTISVSTIFSAINSLTLSPALAAILLKPRGTRRDPLTWILDLLFGWIFKLFNFLFGVSTSAYAWVVGRMLRLSVVVLLVYAALLVVTYFVFNSAPIGFVPQQDQGRLICSIQLPDSSSLQRTQAALKQIAEIAKTTKGVAHTVGISGLSFVMQATSPNYASMFIVLEPFAKRRGLPDTAIMAEIRRKCAKQIKDAQVTVYGASPVPGLGVAGGLKVMIEDRGDLGLSALQQQTDNLVRKLQKEVPGLVGVTTQFRSKVPQLLLNIDRFKTASLGVSLNDVNQTLEIFLGSLYVNSFNQFGRHWQVTLQAEGEFRNRTDDVNLFQVRNNRGQMVPIGTLVNLEEINGPSSVTRYNLYAAAAITGNLAQGFSSGAAIEDVDKIAADSLPLSMKPDWTELMFMQKRAGNTSMYVFALAVVSVFLALAALYESWSLPLAVILVVPLCLLCSVIGVLVSHRDVNIFVQIGLIVLVGLACKNAILIVEFAQQLHDHEGHSRFKATQEASRLRLRPILMTSFAFILGVVPLMLAAGAGAEMRRSLGTAVFSGMLGVTLFGIFLTPVFFYVIQGLGESRLLTAERSRRLGSIFAGGSLGLTIGFLMSQLGLFHVRTACFVGTTTGILVALTMYEIHRRFRTEPTAANLGSESHVVGEQGEHDT
jgi:multidrug efflux pump